MFALQEIEYIRSHFNIEDFIYFNHHKRDEHAHLFHFALNPVFQQYSKHFLKVQTHSLLCFISNFFVPSFLAREATKIRPKKDSSCTLQLDYELEISFS